MDARIMKLDWSIPDISEIEMITTNIDITFSELLIAHYSSERTSLVREVRGNITVKLKGTKGKTSTHIYKVAHTSAIELMAVDSDIVMTQAEIDVVADSIADFLLQNYLKKRVVVDTKLKRTT